MPWAFDEYVYLFYHDSLYPYSSPYERERGSERKEERERGKSTKRVLAERLCCVYTFYISPFILKMGWMTFISLSVWMFLLPYSNTDGSKVRSTHTRSFNENDESKLVLGTLFFVRLCYILSTLNNSVNNLMSKSVQIPTNLLNRTILYSTVLPRSLSCSN